MGRRKKRERVYEKIEQKLYERNWGYVEFADKMGMSYQSIYNKLSDKYKFKQDEIEKMCKLFNCSYDDLF